MADKLQIIVEGAEEIERNLKRLTLDLRTKTMKSAMRAGARIIKTAVVARAPTGGTIYGPYPPGRTPVTPYAYTYRGKQKPGPGNLKQAIVVTARKDADFVTFLVGVTAGRKAKHDAYYARFFELGTSKFGAQPFMGPGFRSAVSPAMAKIKSTIERRIAKVGAK